MIKKGDEEISKDQIDLNGNGDPDQVLETERDLLPQASSAERKIGKGDMEFEDEEDDPGKSALYQKVQKVQGQQRLVKKLTMSAKNFKSGATNDLTKSKKMINEEVEQIKLIFGGNLAEQFKKFNQAQREIKEKPKQEEESSPEMAMSSKEMVNIDEDALDLMIRADDSGSRVHRLASIASNKASQRLNMRKMSARFKDRADQSPANMSMDQRRATIAANVSEIQSQAEPEVGLREKQANEFRDFLHQKYLEEAGQEMRMTNICVDKPGLVCGLLFLLLFVATGVAFTLKYFDLNPPNYRDFLIWENQRTIDWDMQEAAKKELLKSSSGEAKAVRSEKMDRLTVVYLYIADEDQNLLQKNHLEEIERLERKYESYPEWKDLCWASLDDPSCRKDSIISPLSFLKNQGIESAEKASQAQIDKAFYKSISDAKYWKSSGLEQLYNHKEEILREGRVKYMRSFQEFGSPLNIDGEKFNDITDRYIEQRVIVTKYQRKVNDYIETVSKNSLVKTQMFSEELANESFNELVIQDTSYAAISVLLVLAYFCFHLWSVFLASMAMLIILLSFGVTALIYEGLIGVTFFSNLNNLVIFIVLGIAADDFFVMMDAWRQSATIKEFQVEGDDGENQTKKKRMAYTMRRSSRAMFVTSSTTCVAFLANVFSPIMPIKAFGIYAAIIIPANFLLVCAIFPALIMYDETVVTIKLKQFCSCSKKSKTRHLSQQELMDVTVVNENEQNEPTQLQNQPANIEEEEFSQVPPAKAEDKVNNDLEGGDQEENEFNENQEPVNGKPIVISNGNGIEQTPVNIEDGVIEPSVTFEEKEVELGRLEQFFGGFWNRMVFRCRFCILVIFLFWGVYAVSTALKLSPLTEREEYLPLDHPLLKTRDIIEDGFTATGNTVIPIYLFWGVKDINKEKVSKWDPEDLGEAVFDDDLDISSKEAQKSLLNFCKDLREQTFVALQTVNCWVEQFELFLKQKSKRIPLEPDEFNKELKNFVDSPVGSQYVAQRMLTLKDGKLKYFQIDSASVGTKWGTYDELNPIYEQWEVYLGTYVLNAPKGLQSGKFTAGVWFTWMMTEKGFVQSALQGMIIALIFSFIILTAVTCNMLLAFWAIISVGIIVVSVITIMVLQGWQLGVSESVAVVILIGLSVDYVVHLAQDYKHSAAIHKSGKIKQAYQEMGVSIFSGTITTFMAGLALFGGKIITFYKFAVIICSTILISFLTSMLFFGALLHTFGPQRGWCDLCSCCRDKKVLEFRKQQEEELEEFNKKPRSFFDLQEVVQQ